MKLDKNQEEAWARVCERVKEDADKIRTQEKAILADYKAGVTEIDIIKKHYGVTRKYVQCVIECYVEVEG